MRITFCASSMRPAALMRGAIWNATCRALGARPLSNPESSSKARKPGFLAWCKFSRPCLTITRFSPISGTTSATVAMATSLRNDFKTRDSFSAGQSERCKQRLHQLEGHAGAAEVLVGILAIAPVGIQYGERGRKLGLRQVMIGDDDVDAELAAARTTADARMPVSTLMISETPMAAARSITSVRMP